LTLLINLMAVRGFVLPKANVYVAPPSRVASTLIYHGCDL